MKTIIFDLDGTLVDTLADIAGAMNRVLRDIGLPEHPVEAYKGFVGYGLRITAKRALPPECRDDETVRQAGEMLIQYYHEQPINLSVPYPGIPEMLSGLSCRGICLAILSNKAHSLVQMVVGELLSGFPFSQVLGGGNGYPLKPDPASALILADLMGSKPEDILFIGDSEVDIETARRAGMKPAAVAWGFRTPEFLMDSGADILFRLPGDILEFVD